MGKVCKLPDIYLDLFSHEVLELGTQKYPYRTMKAAASEILNHYSHKNLRITVYTKEIYLERDTFYIMNMTKVTLQNHPDYIALGKLTTLVMSADTQWGIPKKCRVHLLKEINLDPSSVLAVGTFSESELSNLRLEHNGIIISRTSFEMLNVEIYSTDVTYAIFALYLQQKQLSMKNIFMNITGVGVPVFDPMDLYLDGIVFETSWATRLVLTSVLSCHYPEAEMNTTTYIHNITLLRESQYPRYATQISASLPGNKTFSHINCTKVSSSPVYFNSCFSMGLNRNCNPADDLETTQIIEYTYHDGNARIRDEEFIGVALYLNSAFQTRKETIYFRNHYFSNMNYHASFGLLLSSFRLTETLHVSNLVFKNVSLVPYIASILQPGSFHADGIYLEEDINLQGKIFQIIIQGDVSIKNVYMKGYTNAGTNQMSPIEVR